MTKHFTSREFNQGTSRAKLAAKDGPVVITERGKPAHVLLTYDEYCKLLFKKPSIADLLYSPETEDFELELPERRLDPVREVDWE